MEDRYADFLLRSLLGAPKLAPMTICIGALCMNGQAAIMAADREVSASAFGLSGAGPDSKIEFLSFRRLIATAGEPIKSSIVEEFRTGRSAGLSGEEAAKAIYETCLRRQHERFEQAATLPILQVDYQTFLQQASANQISSQLLDMVRRKIDANMSKNAYLLASSASDGIHLYGIAEGEPVTVVDKPGFGAIGVGAELALSALYRNPAVKLMPLASAVYFVYEAKKAAERKDGVGEETDMAILAADRDAYFLSKEATDRLEMIYQSKAPPNLTNAEADSIHALLPS